RRHTRFSRDWSSDVCSSDLKPKPCKKRRNKKLSILGVNKMARQLIVKNATPPKSTVLRPRRSDNGPRIAATNAPPNRKKDMEDGAHELLTPKSRVIDSMAGWIRSLQI